MIDKRELRDRINHEDTLLGNRTTSFLLGNGFLMAALGVSDIEFERNIIAVLGIFIAAVWFFVGWQTRQAITVLHTLYSEEFSDDEINKAVFSKIMWQKKIVGTIFGPTELMTLWLPIIIIANWISININIYIITAVK